LDFALYIYPDVFPKKNNQGSFFALQHVEVQRAIIAELGIRLDDREGGGILQGVGQVLASIIHFRRELDRCEPIYSVRQ
jgi:hypothetical protein